MKLLRPLLCIAVCCVYLGGAAPARAAFSDAQTSAITGLLSAFNVPAATVSQVRGIMEGTPAGCAAPAGLSCIPGTTIVEPQSPGAGYTPGFGGGGSAAASVSEAAPSSPADTTPPVLLAVAASPADTSVTVTWDTDEPATSVVDYGSSSAYGAQVSDATLTVLHSVTLTGLAANTTYHYRVGSADASGNIERANDDTVSTYTGGAQALFAAMGAQPDAAHKGYINQFFIDAAPELSKLDGLWMASADSQASTLNWISPGTYTLSAHGSVSFTPYTGWVGGTAGSYLDTGVVLGQGTQYQQDSNSFGGVISSTSPNSTEHTIGGILGGSNYGGTFLRPNSPSTNGVSARSQTSASQVFTASIENAHWDLSRQSSTSGYSVYKNGVSAATFSTTSAPSKPVAPVDLYLLALNNAGAATGTASNLGLSRVAMAYVGGALSDTDIANLYTASNGYLSSVGEESHATLPAAAYALTVSTTTIAQGDTLTYTIATTSISNPAGSVVITQSGDLTDADFDQTLAQAITAAAGSAAGVTFDGVNKLTFSSSFSGTFSFSRTLTDTPASGAVHEVVLSSPVTVSIVEPTAMAFAGAPTVPSNIALAKGVNISGAEFGTVPGTINTDYAYPSDADIDYYAARGFTVVRVPFRWERVQPVLGGPLAIVGDGTGDFEQLEHVVNRITQDGMVAVIDLHNFGRYVVGGTTQLVGSGAVPASDFDDVWSKLAAQFKSNSMVWFNLMNEPSGSIGAGTWERIAQSATNAIRGTGALNRILVPGDGSTAGMSWTSSGNAAAMALYHDPADNAVFDIHQYLDSDNSGTHGTCTVGAGSRLSDFISWAESVSGREGFLGEFAGGDPAVSGQAQCATEINTLVTSAQDSGVFAGWTVWGGGSRWSSSYIFRLEPVSLSDADTNLMTIYKNFLP